MSLPTAGNRNVLEGILLEGLEESPGNENSAAQLFKMYLQFSDEGTTLSKNM